MNIIICLDDNNGISFNNRRQSKDKEVRKKIAELCCGKKLYMDSYSASQFEGECDFFVDEDFLSKAKDEDFCFVERRNFLPQGIKKLYVFKWNRVYPYDVSMAFDVNEYFAKKETYEFTGNSHDNITLDIYERIG